jgi:hypothetical protein
LVRVCNTVQVVCGRLELEEDRECECECGVREHHCRRAEQYYDPSSCRSEQYYDPSSCRSEQ